MNIQSHTLNSMDKREQILEATADLIAQCGLQASPMSKVAQSACCGAGTIYRYFETKDELVQELFSDLAKRTINECLTAYDATACVKVRFYTLWGNFYSYMRSHPRDCTLMEQLSASPAICGDFKEKAMGELHQQLQKLMDDGKAQHLLKDLPNKTLSLFTYGSLVTIAKKQNEMPEKLEGQFKPDDLLNLCWDAIKA